uniref:Uncharacterized protein n=1 Tax=Pithovirus LCPAC102 TaxID=2506587 RepID=A0A481Z696_9VIRU|nr:MAG: hypothetical protein LCPAC102_00930 [Pithovirus LCPAC102]
MNNILYDKIIGMKIAEDLLGAYYGYTSILSNDITKYNIQILYNTNIEYLNNFSNYINTLTLLFKL